MEILVDENGNDRLYNMIYDEILIGQTAKSIKTLTQNDIILFGHMSGDINPIHFNAAYAKTTHFKKIIAPGMWSASLISALIGTHLPGPGSIYLSQTLSFLQAIYIEDEITTIVEVVEKKTKNHVILECKCINPNNVIVTTGIAEVVAPHEKINLPATRLPALKLF